jgi:hypothetical protein
MLFRDIIAVYTEHTLWAEGRVSPRLQQVIYIMIIVVQRITLYNVDSWGSFKAMYRMTPKDVDSAPKGRAGM